METLPDEILIKVLTYLSPDQLVTASEVSQTFARLSSDPSLWKTISLTEDQTIFLKKERAKRHPHTSLLTSRLLTLPDLAAIVKKILGTVKLSVFNTLAKAKSNKH